MNPSALGTGGYRDEPDEYAAAMGKLGGAAESKDIWGPDEIPDKADVALDAHDERPRPPFKIMYKQCVSTEDQFLGMSGATPGQCSHLVVLVLFPRCSLADLELDVTRKVLCAQSSTHRLRLALPYPVKENDGKAEFDSDKGELKVTLPIIVQEPWEKL
jgi:hypothetical protein